MIIGLDVGGTHADVVLLSQAGLEKQAKVPTDESQLFETVLAGLDAVTEGVDPAKIRRIVLSTTLAANLVVQRKLPPVGMIVAGGPGIDPALFAPNEHYRVVKGAMDHRGREIAPLDEREIQEAAEQFKKEGIRYMGVVTKFSVHNPDHEKRMAAIVAPFCDQVFMGHQFSGNLNFPRRIDTTYLNAAVFPVHKAFFEAVKGSLAKKGLNVPLRILKPDGGNMNFESSFDHPALTILSGPSASVMGALTTAPSSGATWILDIGGTTTDMALLIDGVPLLAPLGIEIGPYKTLIRALQTHSIGVGGDSVVRMEEGALTVGPDRTGRAMAYGGTVPTPTDAFRVLGLMQGGDLGRAEAGLTPIAQQLGVGLETAAVRIVEQACRQILDAANEMLERINSKPVYTVHELWEGSEIRPRHLMVLGGPATQFAEYLMKQFDGSVSVVPHCEVANAIGCALARTTSEITLFADTSCQLAVASGELFNSEIPAAFTLEDARELALQLLREKALRRGANPDHLELEIVDAYQFNMIRGFTTIGKNIRVRAQVKPGLIQGYDPIGGKLRREDL
ncbi:hydantoinase/oxoprolinase family protein [Desulfatitalea alkaliphila]|uniref:Hydantoinase/oxoprolinase family protein n=1 Tax=Desulfatitalea alkaliphila TaxID=2929485 RepID=A0AA41QZB3_9BACT|nr:hydantoinase/oxoprolinase family protein [Desulfatitalea alkaliphila]MCJ8499862.1 hydantoinase/oxoprolinase family protein [Desulfatitalea alkaliphila]